MDAEVDYDGSGDDAPAQPASHSANLTLSTPSGSAEQTTDAPAETLAGPVPAVYSAALTPTQWAALPPNDPRGYDYEGPAHSPESPCDRRRGTPAPATPP